MGGREQIFQKILPENFLELMKCINPSVLGSTANFEPVEHAFSYWLHAESDQLRCPLISFKVGGKNFRWQRKKMTLYLLSHPCCWGLIVLGWARGEGQKHPGRGGKIFYYQNLVQPTSAETEGEWGQRLWGRESSSVTVLTTPFLSKLSWGLFIWSFVSVGYWQETDGPLKPGDGGSLRKEPFAKTRAGFRDARRLQAWWLVRSGHHLWAWRARRRGPWTPEAAAGRGPRGRSCSPPSPSRGHAANLTH